MPIPEPLAEALNDQINLELASSLAYLQFSTWFEGADLPGMELWMRLQADEEHAHAIKFLDHVLDREAPVSLGPLPAARTDFASPIDVFRAALEHEQVVSEAIRDLYRLATEVGDLDSLPLLQWFINEQVEEESTVREIIGRLDRIGGDGPSLILLDRELGERPPEATA